MKLRSQGMEDAFATQLAQINEGASYYASYLFDTLRYECDCRRGGGAKSCQGCLSQGGGAILQQQGGNRRDEKGVAEHPRDQVMLGKAASDIRSTLGTNDLRVVYLPV